MCAASSSDYIFVLVHGGFHGGWCWRRVAHRLRAHGHEVFTPTQTGLGERAHLLNDSIGVESYVQDIVNVLEAEELDHVVLVGHSLGGISITGAADRVPERISKLVYIDALIVDDNQIVEDQLQQGRSSSDASTMEPFAVADFGITEPADADWVTRRMTPQPLQVYRDRVRLNHPIGNFIPTTYIASTMPWYKPTEPTRRWVHEQTSWDWRELATGHDSMITAPDLVTETLLSIIETDKT